MPVSDVTFMFLSFWLTENEEVWIVYLSKSL